jgi:primosomal protein N' (replication factor Y)
VPFIVIARQYAKVIIDLVNDGVDKPFDYLLPPELLGKIQIGSRVIVPFRSGKMKAFVVSLVDKTSLENVKEVLKLDSSPAHLSEEQVSLSYWVSRYFFTRWIEVIRLCLPPGGGKVKPRYEEIILPLQPDSFLLEESNRIKGRAPRQSAILEHIAKSMEGITWDKLRKEAGVSRQSLTTLVKKGFLRIEKSPLIRRPWQKKMLRMDKQPKLVFTGQQEKAWQDILKGFEGPQKHFLMHGITGSGKTELYFRAAEKVLGQGKTVLILIPEIALTPVLISQFRGRFAGQFALLHSSLSPGERYDMWWKVKKGEARIVLGARSAVFAPLENIGLIVIDEEHENAYKQEDSPRYHARDVAWQRAIYHGALLLMGSATPSLDSYQKVQQGKLGLIEISERVEGRLLPSVQIVDMRREFRQKNRSIFSRALFSAIEETLKDGDQLILFLNRRGFAGFQLCRVCGHVMRCPNCSVSLTYHTSPEHLQCHICGYRKEATHTCPECHSPYLRSFGLGTQKVEKEMAALFPGVKIIRMDSDATSSKGAHYRMWKAFNDRKAQVLIGTQMVAKGLDFPGVTLVGVVAADITLHLPDFRAGERTFQLLAQVAGRAGRGEKKGRVLIQTYTPWHYSIKRAASHDYQGFIAEEAGRRKSLAYPPFAEMLLFCCSSKDGERAAHCAGELKKRLGTGLPNDGGKFVLSEPFPAPLQKREGYFRYHVVYKGDDLHRFADDIRAIVWDFRGKLHEDVRLTVDFNPLMML